MTVADITRCMRANVVDRGSLREIELVTTDREGKQRKVKIKEALKLLVDEEASKMINEDDLKLRAVENAEQNGIVFIDVRGGSA